MFKKLMMVLDHEKSRKPKGSIALKQARGATSKKLKPFEPSQFIF